MTARRRYHRPGPMARRLRLFRGPTDYRINADGSVWAYDRLTHRWEPITDPATLKRVWRRYRRVRRLERYKAGWPI